MQHSHNLRPVAIAATLHCLTGCALGEISGLVIGEIFSLSNIVTIALATTLAFIFGYTFSAVPLMRQGASFTTALRTVFLADTLSILTMEIVDNIVMYLVPGAMGAGIVNPIFWLSMSGALFVAFWAAYPVNRYLIERGKGHALIHAQHSSDHSHEHHHHAHHEHANHDMAPQQHTMDNRPLLYAIIAFLLGGLLVATAATTFDRAEYERLSEPATHRH